MTAPLRLAPAEGDAACMERIARGEMEALGALYDCHRPALHHFLSRALGSGGDVEDLVQETFLLAARAAGRFDGRQSCRPFLVGIAARLVQERSRRVGRLTLALRRFAHAAPATLEPSPALEARSSLGRVAAALEHLPAGQRVVVLMTEVEGMSGAEIARALSIPEGTVWRRLHAARVELRKALAGETR